MPGKIQNFTDDKSTNIILEVKLEEVLTDLHPSDQLRALEKLAMKIRKANSIRINEEVNDRTRLYSKTKKG